VIQKEVENMIRLGCQIRVPIPQLTSLWTSERRAQYLLVPSVEAPMSADPRVWPIADSADLAKLIFDNFVSGPYEAPNGLNLFHLRNNATNFIPLGPENPQVVSIEVENEIASQLATKRSIELGTLNLSEKKQNRRLLGFDVCDDTLLSGLMNCGTSAEHRAKLRRNYVVSLNNRGLFDDPLKASKFAVDLSSIVPEHGPFFQVGLYNMA
jgi:hypothetical protein